MELLGGGRLEKRKEAREGKEEEKKGAEKETRVKIGRCVVERHTEVGRYTEVADIEET